MRLYVPWISLCLSVAMVGVSPAVSQWLGDRAQSASAATDQRAIQDWFTRYDAIRRAAQMTPAERAKSDNVMSRGLSALVPGEDKPAVQAFLNKLAQKNATAAEQLKQLPLYPETEALHRGYYQYFQTAAQVFRDWVTVQNNMFAVDASGKAIIGSLAGRKLQMEELDKNNKTLDAQLRQQFNIPAYRY